MGWTYAWLPDVDHKTKIDYLIKAYFTYLDKKENTNGIEETKRNYILFINRVEDFYVDEKYAEIYWKRFTRKAWEGYY